MNDLILMRKIHKKFPNVTYEEVEKEVLENYCVLNKGQVATGRKYGLSPNQVKYILTKNNIAIRNFSEAATVSNENRAKKVNENFFFAPSSNMAWILGFFAADGWISKKRNTLTIGLARRDREILGKIKKEIEIEAEVKDYVNSNGFDCSKLDWSCRKHKEDLSKYNIVPEKTFSLLPPHDLPKQFWVDYIRGFFDGDGSVSYLKTNKALCWQVCSTTIPILEWIVNFLYEEYQIPKVRILEQQRQQPLYYFQYSTNATRRIYEILYTKDSLFLARKKQHFQEAIELMK